MRQLVQDERSGLVGCLGAFHVQLDAIQLCYLGSYAI
jgi:hypothetical protein